MRKLLVANRGEIAVRVMRTAKAMGLHTVAVYSQADVNALHTTMADEAVLIGPPPVKESYLNSAAILKAAKETGADAIHPGYGFLSESAVFSKACRDAGLIFVGPPTAAISAMGDKVQARERAQRADIPVILGSPKLVDVTDAKKQAERIGLPVLLKAAGGGGGIGMQKVAEVARMDDAFAQTQEKAKRFFANPSLYLEKALRAPRHIEIQIAADAFGSVVHLGERECSIQRRHQKVLEETPSAAVQEPLRQEMTAAAIRLAKAVGYASLGTIEMLVDDHQFYFLEMNTRLQVEHTVTEMVTGLDLVEWQLRIAQNERLPQQQEHIVQQGHAIQCRIYAENPEKGFLPSPGTLRQFAVPHGEGIRNDVGVRGGDVVTPYYDPMLAKLVVYGAHRNQAIDRCLAALRTYRVEGVATNIGMHCRILEDANFRAGQFDTGFLTNQLKLRA